MVNTNLRLKLIILTRKFILKQLVAHELVITSPSATKATDVIFLDFSKAFDRVPHERLLLKWNRHGIDGNLLLWLRNFLTERKQRVNILFYLVISEVRSTPRIGPGPVLCLIYVNDLTDIVTSDIKLFADDTKIYRQLTEPEDINVKIGLTCFGKLGDKLASKL